MRNPEAVSIGVARPRVRHLPMLMLAVLSLTLFAAPQAGADMATYHLTFSATGFTRYGGTATIPKDPVTGSFFITIDPTQTYTDDTADITGGVNIALDSQLSFNYYPFFGGIFNIGGLHAGAGGYQVINPDNDFVVVGSGLTTTLSLQGVDVVQSGTGDGSWISNTVSGEVVATPVPPSVLLLGSGLIPLAWARSRKGWRK